MKRFRLPIPKMVNRNPAKGIDSERTRVQPVVARVVKIGTLNDAGVVGGLSVASDEEATTASLEALKAFSAGRRASMTESLVAGIPLQKRALELDPNFALAWAHLALTYADTGQTGAAGEAAKRAYVLRNRATDRERFFIDVVYDRTVTGNLERTLQTCMSWVQAYPRDPDAHGLASGMIPQGLGDFDISIEEARKALALDPDPGPVYTNLAYSYFLEGRMKEALEVVQQTSARGFNPPEMLVLRYAIAFAAEDNEGMKRAAAMATGKPWAEDWMTQFEALAAADWGQIRLARQLSRKARELAIGVGQPERAAGYQSAFAVDEALFGYPAEAIRAATEALEMSHARDVEYTAALASAWPAVSSSPMLCARTCVIGFQRIRL